MSPPTEAQVAPPSVQRAPAARRPRVAGSPNARSVDSSKPSEGGGHAPADASAGPVGIATNQAAAAPGGDGTQFGPPPPNSAVDAGPPASAGAPSTAAPVQSAVPTNAAGAAASAGLTDADSSNKQYELAEVKIRDNVVLRLKLEDGGLVPAERARRATRAIEAAMADAQPGSVRTEMRQDRALLFVGQRPIVELTRADAAAIGEGSLELLAASAAAKIGDVLENERQRSMMAHNVLNVTLVIALAVAVLYVLRLLGIAARRTRDFVNRNPDRVPAIHLRSIEVIGPHVLRSGIVVGIGVLKLLLQLSLVFAWLLFSSSLFEATQSFTERLTSLVLTPLSGLATRFAALLPLLLLTTIGLVVLVVLLRFVTLFFAGVERRETELSWLRPELAAPTSLLIRIGLVVVSLLVLAPLVTGNVEGSLARVGMLSVVAIALATTPLTANVLVGLVTLYGGRLQLGDEIVLGSHAGTLTSVDLVELRLTTSDGRVLRVPHLVTLVRPLVVSTKPSSLNRRLLVTAEARFDRVIDVLTAASGLPRTTSVRLVRIEDKLTTVFVTPSVATEAAQRQVLELVAKELEGNQIRLVLAEWQNIA